MPKLRPSVGAQQQSAVKKKTMAVRIVTMDAELEFDIPVSLLFLDDVDR